MTSPSHTYKISVLVFIRRTDGDILLIERKRPPNRGQWSPIGGKLEMALGESPHECAVRETREETGLDLAIDDLHLFAMIAEKAYEGGSHWLMFLFDCRKTLTEVPPDIDEGTFAFHPRHRIDQLHITLFRKMVRIRKFEQSALQSYQKGKMGGFLHLYIGQEATAVG
jgi:8-oxo-dGTP diphosphatase